MPEHIENWMADCAAILNTQPSEMSQWPLEELARWHKHAIARAPNEQ